MILRHIPNILTIARLILIVPFLTFVYQKNYHDAFYTFIIAGSSDCLDGWLARSYHWQSSFGRLIDPIADKLLISSSFISLGLSQFLPWWLVFLVLMRDLTISFGALAWYCFINREFNFEPTFLSKINTVLQLTLVVVALFELTFFQIFPHFTELLILITTCTTAASYLDYVFTWASKVPRQTRAT